MKNTLTNLKTKEDFVHFFLKVVKVINKQQSEIFSLLYSAETNTNDIKKKVLFLKQKSSYDFNNDVIENFEIETSKHKVISKHSIYNLLNQYSDLFVSKLQTNEKLKLFNDKIENKQSFLFSLKDTSLVNILSDVYKNYSFFNEEENKKFQTDFLHMVDFIEISNHEINTLKEMNEDIIDVWKLVEKDYKIVFDKVLEQRKLQTFPFTEEEKKEILRFKEKEKEKKKEIDDLYSSLQNNTVNTSIVINDTSFQESKDNVPNYNTPVEKSLEIDSSNDIVLEKNDDKEFRKGIIFDNCSFSIKIKKKKPKREQSFDIHC